MTRTKQTQRLNQPGDMGMLPQLPTGPQVNSTAQKKRKSSTSSREQTKQSTPCKKPGRPKKKKKKKEINYLFDLVRKAKGCKTEADVKKLLISEKLDFIDWLTRKSRETFYEDRFLHEVLKRVEHCKHEIFDVFGEGNCLFYCLLLMLKLENNTTLSNSPTVTTRYLVAKLRKQLVDYFIERYEDPHDAEKMRLRLEILPPDNDE